MTVLEEIISYFMYVFQGIVLALLCNAVLTPRRHPAASFFAMILAQISPILVFGIYQGNYNGIKFAVGVGAALVLLQLFYRERLLVKALIWFSFTLLSFLAEIIIIFLHFVVLGLAMEEMYIFSIRTIWSVIALVVMAVGAWILAVFYRRFFQKKRSTLSTIVFLQFLLHPISQCVLVWSFLMNTALGLSTSSLLLFVSAVLLCLAANLVTYRTMTKTARTHELELQLAEAEFAAHVQHTEYQAMLAAEQNLAHYRHDNKNRLAAIAALLRSGRSDAVEQALELLDGMTQALTVTHGTFCANNIVDAILAVKQSECRQYDIRLHHSLLLERELPFEGLALCSVFSNLMDNAIRACRSLPAHQRDITLTARVEGGFLLVKLQNPLPGPDAEKGSGLGLKILRQIAEQYTGEVIAEEEDGNFCILVALRLPEAPAPQTK